VTFGRANILETVREWPVGGLGRRGVAFNRRPSGASPAEASQ